MRPELKPLLWVGAATLVAVLAVGMLRARADRTEAPAPATAEEPQPAAPPVPQRSVTGSDAGPLPWQRDLGTGTARGADALPAPAAPGASMDRAQFMATMETQLQRNQMAADAALQRIAEVQASGQVPEGVDLEALRGNLQIAKQAQSLAMELARAGGEADSPARQQKIAAITAQLQALQTRLQAQAALQPASSALPATRNR